MYLWSGGGLGLKGLFWLLNFCFCFSYYLTGLFWSGVWVSLVSSKTFLCKYSLVLSCLWWYLVNEWHIWFLKGFAFVCVVLFSSCFNLIHGFDVGEWGKMCHPFKLAKCIIFVMWPWSGYFLQLPVIERFTWGKSFFFFLHGVKLIM